MGTSNTIQWDLSASHPEVNHNWNELEKEGLGEKKLIFFLKTKSLDISFTIDFDTELVT